MRRFEKKIVGYGIVDKQSGEFFNVHATGYVDTIADSETGVTSDFYWGYSTETRLQHIYNVSDFSIDFNRFYSFDNTAVKKAQTELDQLLGYHKSILEKNLLCARGLELVTETGAAVPTEFRQRLYNLQAKLINRNNALKTGGYVEDIQEGEHPQLSDYNQALVTFMNNPGIGFVISGTAIIIIMAVVAAASAAIAYTIFKKMHTEAKADYAFSNDLTAELVKYLPPQVYEQLMKENAANQAAAQDAIDNAKGGGIITAVKTGGLVLLGVWIADKFIFNKKD